MPTHSTSEDRRAILVTLTDQGSQTMAQMEHERSQIAAELVADLDANQQERLRKAWTSSSPGCKVSWLLPPLPAARAHDRHDRNAVQEELVAITGYIARRATMMELHGYQSIYRFVFRRPKVPGSVRLLQSVLPILTVFVVASALVREMPAGSSHH